MAPHPYEHLKEETSKEEEATIPALNSVVHEGSPTCDNSDDMSCPHVYDGKEILKHQMG